MVGGARMRWASSRGGEEDGRSLLSGQGVRLSVTHGPGGRSGLKAKGLSLNRGNVFQGHRFICKGQELLHAKAQTH